ncbi:MAG: transporter [Clostridiales bacterium]|nr:transporter [Clostridiales bacterium]
MKVKGQRKIKGKWLSKVFVIAFAALILFFPQPSFHGAKNGLLLWFNTILPTLLPFMIISNLIVNMDIAKLLGRILYPFFKLIFRVSKNACYPILIGLLSGIPVGAKVIADLIEREDIDLKEGQYLLSFCNNASPSFVMSFIAITQLKQPSLSYKLLLINFLSGFIGALIYFKIPGKFTSIKNTLKYNNSSKRPYSLHTLELSDYSYQEKNKLTFDFSMLDNAIMDSFEVITKVGGYIILFSIPAQIISSSTSVSPIIKISTIGILEITTGINYVANTSLNQYIKTVLIVAITTFGGLSALAQTNSVISKTKLSIITYLKNKIIQMIIAIVLITLIL